MGHKCNWAVSFLQRHLQNGPSDPISLSIFTDTNMLHLKKNHHTCFPSCDKYYILVSLNPYARAASSPLTLYSGQEFQLLAGIARRRLCPIRWKSTHCLCICICLCVCRCLCICLWFCCQEFWLLTGIACRLLCPIRWKTIHSDILASTCKNPTLFCQTILPCLSNPCDEQ